MRYILPLAVTALLAVSAAYAQENPAGLTLDAQLQNMKQKQQAKQAQPALPPAELTEPVTQPAPVESVDSVGGGAIPALPLEVQTAGTVRYLNGGIGDEELAELKSEGANYNLHLLLTGKAGEYVGGVNLRVIDDKNTTILSIEDAGPYVFAKLPAGSYTLEATAAGIAKKTTVKIPATGSVKPQVRF